MCGQLVSSGSPKMIKWLIVGRALVLTGAILIALLAAVALAGIESPTSFTWVTLSILAFLLMLAGQFIRLITFANRRRRY
jgi:hypothetical protein